MMLLHKCTLDIIGLAGMRVCEFYQDRSLTVDHPGFEYDFGVLDQSNRPNELNDAMRKMFSTRLSVLDVVHTKLPTTRMIVRPLAA